MGLKVFVGFDGTVTTNDVGRLFFQTFGGSACHEIFEDYRKGSLSALECFRREAQAMGIFSKTEADLFVGAQPVDSMFREFVGFCRDEKIDLAIVSDGLDYFVREILCEQDISGVSVYANATEFVPAPDGDGFRMQLTFPFTDAECRRCACCKRNILLTTAADEDLVVYIGEGYSDACPVRYADIVFAKQQLQTFCQKENITYYPYDTFRDVAERLARLRSGGGRLRKRKSATLRRREAFLSE